MSIKHAILGYLGWRPFTGYELKRTFADSEAFHWSGNSNQIYRTLLQLQEEELVTQEVQHQEHLPSRKIYTITPRGRAELRRWLQSPPELPEMRSSFLVQLAWADALDPAELDELVARYAHEVEMQLLMCREKARRGGAAPARTPREAYLWQMVEGNRIAAYESELAWVGRVQRGLAEMRKPDEGAAQ